MHDKFAHSSSLSRHSAFLVFRSINLNSAESVPHVNRALPMMMWKFFFSFTLLFLAAYTKWGFEHSAHWSINIVLATCCLQGWMGFCDDNLLMSLMMALQIHLFMFWKLPGKVYNASRHLRVLGLVSDPFFQNLGHLIEVVNRFHNFDFHIFLLKINIFFDNSSGLSIGWVSAFYTNHQHNHKVLLICQDLRIWIAHQYLCQMPLQGPEMELLLIVDKKIDL